jgi:hypothetical protein
MLSLDFLILILGKCVRRGAGRAAVRLTPIIFIGLFAIANNTYADTWTCTFTNEVVIGEFATSTESAFGCQNSLLEVSKVFMNNYDVANIYVDGSTPVIYADVGTEGKIRIRFSPDGLAPYTAAYPYLFFSTTVVSDGLSTGGGEYSDVVAKLQDSQGLFIYAFCFFAFATGMSKGGQR